MIAFYYLIPSQDLSELPQNVPEALYATMVAHQASALVLKSSQARSFFVYLGDVLNFSGNTDQYVIPGNIIVRQRGTQFHPGQHVRLSYTTSPRDHINTDLTR